MSKLPSLANCPAPPGERRARHVIAAVLASVLVACGGSDALVPGEMGRDQPQALANIVLHADSSAVRHSGSFEATAGHLAQGRRVLRSSGGNDASLHYAFGVPRRGYYEAFVYWPQALPDAGHASIEVRHVRGTTAATVDQRVGGEWITLGIFEFDPAAQSSITLRQVGSGPLYADAVRLQFAGTDRPPLQWRIDALPVGLKDTLYTGKLAVAGGTAPYTFDVFSGTLPPGLALDAATGEVRGRAAVSGQFPLVIAARDARGAVITQTLTVVVDDSAAGELDPPGLEPRKGVSATGRARALAAGAPPDLAGMLNLISAMPEGGWSKANLNKFSDVWTPADLRPLHANSNPTPSKIIIAWSSFIWDSNRGKLVLYGGGHANYRGNDVYTWNASSRLWERAALPSAMRQDVLGNWNAIDGVAKAPASAHTYDNSMFFPQLDRVVVLGGAADANGGHYLTQATATTSRKTGPYLFDPNRADGNKVGGSTGSHVTRVAAYPEVLGGDMWSNRESWLNANVNSAPPSESFVNGCTGVALENGRDVAYVRTAYRLYRYEISDLSNPAADTWRLVGRYYGGSGAQAACAFDTQRRLFVSTNRNAPAPFNFWNLNSAGASNNEVYFTPSDATGEFAALLAANAIDIRYCGLEYDSRRSHYKLWCGDGRVWTLASPATPSATGWTIQKAPTPPSPVPTEGVGTGILGKWKYIPSLDVFMGLTDPVLGNIWIYKPVGWTNPSGGNLPPSVNLTQPAQGSVFTAGSNIAVSANAADLDGSIARVEFLAGGVKIGEAAAAPYAVTWTSVAAGSYAITAVATDDAGTQATSTAINITVNSGQGASVILQRGTTPSALVADTYLSDYHTTLAFGSIASLQDQRGHYSPLLRFAIFQSEGGPVPMGAVITSATLSVYKYSSYDMVYGAHRVLQPWTEAGATWNQRAPGLPWAVGGGNGLDADFAAVADATAASSFEPGWIHFNVTNAVGAMSTATTLANHGWRLRAISGYTTGLKRIYSSESAADPLLRPKLVISYQ